MVKAITANQHIGQRGKWWVVHPAAEAHFFFVEADKVMLGRKLDRVVVRVERLQNHLARGVAAPGASRDLRKQLKGAFGSAKVRESQRIVCADYTDHSDTVNVMPLGDHLRAH